VTALGNFGLQAVSYFPALTNALTDADPYVRFCAAEALRNIAFAALTNGPPDGLAPSVVTPPRQ